MYHGRLTAAALADQLAARFNERHQRTQVTQGQSAAMVQIGSQYGTPLTLNIAETEGGVLVTMSADRNWLDRLGDAGDRLERVAQNPLSLLAALPDILAEGQKKSLAPEIWAAVDDICSLSRALAGEKNAPRNPKVCTHCQTANPPELEQCQACGAPLPVDLPRVCPKCGRGHTSDALFCQACGTRLVQE
jgi:ribosomal protein L40E